MNKQKYVYGANGVFEGVRSGLDSIVRIADNGLINPNDRVLVRTISFVAKNIRELEKLDQDAFINTYSDFQKIRLQYPTIKYFKDFDDLYELTKAFDYVCKKQIR